MVKKRKRNATKRLLEQCEAMIIILYTYHYFVIISVWRHLGEGEMDICPSLIQKAARWTDAELYRSNSILFLLYFQKILYYVLEIIITMIHFYFLINNL